MTDRIRTLKVLLNRDTRTDDAEVIKNAILMIKGVSKVEDGEVVGVDEHFQRAAILGDFIKMQMELLCLANSNGEDAELYRQIRELIAQSYRRKTGKDAFG